LGHPFFPECGSNARLTAAAGCTGSLAIIVCVTKIGTGIQAESGAPIVAIPESIDLISASSKYEQVNHNL